eukprot:5259998-Amphidinium_carterae.1
MSFHDRQSKTEEVVVPNIVWFMTSEGWRVHACMTGSPHRSHPSRPLHQGPALWLKADKTLPKKTPTMSTKTKANDQYPHTEHHYIEPLSA